MRGDDLRKELRTDLGSTGVGCSMTNPRLSYRRRSAGGPAYGDADGGCAVLFKQRNLFLAHPSHHTSISPVKDGFAVHQLLILSSHNSKWTLRDLCIKEGDAVCCPRAHCWRTRLPRSVARQRKSPLIRTSFETTLIMILYAQALDFLLLKLFS
jgi:hypothetical protein